jgi:hypothetical protein
LPLALKAIAISLKASFILAATAIVEVCAKARFMHRSNNADKEARRINMVKIILADRNKKPPQRVVIKL